LDIDTFTKILNLQKNEITEHLIYSKLASKSKDKHNKEILKQMSADELKHYKFWKSITKQDIKPNLIKVYFYMLLSNIFGLSFGLRLMEKGEKLTAKVYKGMKHKLKKNVSIIRDEHKHEEKLLCMIQEERVEYAGSVVLGLNDALVELTGALAGLTFALQNGTLVALSGFIIGIAASLSMAASSFLASREETDSEDSKNPIKAAIYTGISYLVTVILLIIPYLIFDNVFTSLIATLSIAILIIATYTYYISTVKNLKFWRRFCEMAAISLGIALISFGIGYALRIFLGVEI
tara:strand:- start:793 stop:1668 length:876 start_codon:yes stop_codon:yes gene_type:complete